MDSRCEKYNLKHSGKSLANYILKVNTVKSEIGEIKDNNGKLVKGQLSVYGTTVYENNEQGSLLMPSEQFKYKKEDVFNSILNNSAEEVLVMYLNSISVEQSIKNELIKKLRLLENNKLLPMPLKTGEDCLFTKIGSKEQIFGKISNIKYYIDKESNKMLNEVSIKYKDREKEAISYEHIAMSEYLKRFEFDISRVWKGIGKSNKNIIDITTNGFIRPIMFKGISQSIIFDGTFVYMTGNQGSYIIGKVNFEEGKYILYDKSIIDERLLGIINNNIELITKHKNYIAPYLMVECIKC